MVTKDTKIIKRVVTTVLILLSFFMIFTVVRISAYTVLIADDFDHGNAVGAFHTDFFTYLWASLKFTAVKYMEWQGTYFSMFIQALLSPINNFGLPQLRVVMIANALLFFGSLVYLIFTLVRGWGREQLMMKMIIVTLIVFMLTSYQAYEEVFYWFSGATSYSIPLSFLMLGIAFVLRTSEEKYIVNLVLAVITGVMAMGGSLTVTGTGCYVLLMLGLYAFLRDKKLDKKIAVIFGFWLLGAIINAAAPGNFVRHEVIDDTGVHPLGALKNAFYMLDERYQWFFDNTNIVVILIILMICGVFAANYKKFNLKAYLVTSVLALATPAVTAFPVVLGYSRPSSLPVRCLFLIDVSVILSLSNMFFIIGVVIRNVLREEAVKEIAVILAVLCICSAMMDSYGLKSVKLLDLNHQLRADVYKNYYEECVSFYDRLEQCEKGTDVAIPANEAPSAIYYFHNFYLTKKPKNWVNKAVAEYYGLKSLKLYDAE